MQVDQPLGLNLVLPIYYVYTFTNIQYTDTCAHTLIKVISITNLITINLNMPHTNI